MTHITTPTAEPTTARDLRLDVLRAGALAVVVIWHWVFTSLDWSSSGPHTDNPVTTHPWLWTLTWFAQPMCVFFAVGGALHARDRRRPGEFYAARLRRLLPPVLPLVTVALAVILAADATGNAAISRAVTLAVSPMWFLGVYLVLIALAPAGRWAHARAGVLVQVVLLATVALVDTWRLSTGADHLVVQIGMLCLTWAFVHQLGFHLTTLFTNRRAAACLATTGLLALCALSLTPRYPAAMVGSSASHMSNMGPPNLMVAALAMFQLGLISLAAAPLARIAERVRDHLAVVNQHSMRIFTWHMVAFVAFAVLAHRLGLDNDLGSQHWWETRPLWLAGPLAVYLTAAALTRAAARRPITRARRPTRTRPARRTRRT